MVEAYRVFTAYDELSYAILDRPRPDQVAVLEDESGIPTLIHLSETEADAMTWLEAHPHPKARIAPKLGTLTYLQDPDRGWLIVTRAALKAAGMSPTDFSCSSHVLEHLFALEEDADMPKFLKRLDARGIAYRLQEHHVKGDAYCRYWDLNTRPLAAAG